MTAADWLHQFDPDASRQDIHGLLGQMLFSGEEGLKPTEALSGGETARLLFCRIMLQKPNVLILDEPTNHLDLEAINALNIALQKFEGTVLLVTHDQDLMEEVGTRVWHFDHGKIRTSRAPTKSTKRRSAPSDQSSWSRRRPLDALMLPRSFFDARRFSRAPAFGFVARRVRGLTSACRIIEASRSRAAARFCDCSRFSRLSISSTPSLLILVPASLINPL